MSIVGITYSQPDAPRSWLSRPGRALSDVRVLAWRTLFRIAATPEQLLNVTVQPLILVLLFSYVFNGAVILPVHGSYRDYLIAGRTVAGLTRGSSRGDPNRPKCGG